ncbi:MAG: hypothetical protein IKH57_11310 [Clostridia bacterium]|nr:hypothetical protein [Clostridia bacterium]
MAKKELSPYAPDRWIRELNRRYPNIWVDLRKGFNEPHLLLGRQPKVIEMLRKVHDWCIMPTFFPGMILMARYGDQFYFSHMDEIMTIATMYTWRASKGVYRFAQEIYDALVNQPLTCDIPWESLHHLPEWAVFVETPGLSYERHPMEGFIAQLDYNFFSDGVDLQFAIFLKGRDQPTMVAFPLGKGGLAEAMDRVDEVDNLFAGHTEKTRYIGSREEYRRTFSAMMQLLLYLCSDEPDLPEIEHPRKRITLSGGVRAPEAPRVWDVGVRISHVLRGHKNKSSDTEVVYINEGEDNGHASPRPHIRSAHWHTYWTGPRDAVFPERKPVLRWIPPIPIGVDWKKEMPTNIKLIG